MKCPKCGAIPLEKDLKTQSHTCFQCGFIVRGSHEMHTLIQSNRKEIAQDYLSLGLADTMYKWGISTTALYRIPEVRELKGKYRKLLHAGGGSGDAPSLPAFPAFNNSWVPEVQLKWLSIYEGCIRRTN